MWDYTILEKDGKEVILVTGDTNAGEKGWVVCEMPLPDIQPLRDEQIARAILMCASPLMVKVLRETKVDVSGVIGSQLAGNMRAISLNIDRALAYAVGIYDEEE
jgi:hypothetical protein